MRSLLLCLALGTTLSLSACAPGYYQQGRRLAGEGNTAEAVPLFYREIEEKPAESRAWRELGVAFYEQGDLARSEEALKQAAAIAPDGRTHLYLGLIHEKKDESELALGAYRVALGLNPGGDTRDLLESRVYLLVHEQVMREARAALDAEKDLDTAHIPDNTVAVVEFNSAELPPDLVPLAKGMAEFTAQDLGKVGSLQIVDRLKIDAIRQELELSQSEFADAATAPRIGRLVGSHRLVTGTLLGLGDESFRLSGAVINTSDASVATPEFTDGDLEEFFRVQKGFVFDVIAAMDITLTPEERTAIEEVPTENFLALMAYCNGLAYRDQNRLNEAQTAFQGATAHDKGFNQAAVQEKSVASLLSAGPGGSSGSIAKFSGQASLQSNLEILSAELSSITSSLIAWNGFVPTNLDLDYLSSFVDTPPRTRYQGDVSVIIRGNLDARP